MYDFENKLCGAEDKFRFVLERPEGYQGLESFRRWVAQIRDVLNRGLLRAEDTASVDLALIRLERIRFNLDSQSTSTILDDIERCATGHPVLGVQVRLMRAELALFAEGDAASARKLFEALAYELRPTDQHFLYALVANGLGVTLATLGDDSAEDCFQDAISTFRRLGNEVQHAYSLNNYGVLKKKLCEYREGEQLFKKALLLFARLGAVDGQILCYNNLGIVCVKKGDWNSAEYWFAKALALRDDGGSKEMGDARYGRQREFLYAEINLTHLRLLRREFRDVGVRLDNLLKVATSIPHRRHEVLLHEFIGECHLELEETDHAGIHLDQARDIAQRIGPQSDIMTEVKRRVAQLHLLQKDWHEAKQEALECIRLCKKIRDKHELGAALRILGEAYIGLGLPKKAVTAFEASINTLKSIGECYELMRSCIAYSCFLIDAKSRDAEVCLLEAKQLCKKLEIDFFSAQVLLLYSKYDYNCGNYESATSNLKMAGDICDTLQQTDRKILHPSIREWYKTLEQAILKTSMESAEKLKSIGKIYEEARFPMEELKSELATEVARNVGAESLFLAQRKSGGFRIALKYNISANDAKHTLRRQVKCDIETLFEGRDPKICEMANGKSLVSIPGQTDLGYILCTVIDVGKAFTPRDLEFLFASVEALERVAEEYSVATPHYDVDGFLDENKPLSHPGGHFKTIITLDTALIRTIRLAERASETTVPVLLEGETGVGKELFAQAIHANSPRVKNQFVAINAGGVPLNLLESQLFGHVKGAFTDAMAERVGLIEEAKGGTLFFDEVGEMSEELQVKLLRLLENGEFRRLGENAVRYADIRVVSATNKDLQERVEKGLFREDLYFRLATVRFKIPPLRERKRDIEFLARHFLAEGLEKIGKPRRLVHMDMKALEAFEIYHWPGNVRELKNEILRILSLIGEGELIRFGMLSERIKEAFRSKNDGGVLSRRVERYERRLILKALEENDWNRSKTADQIGIPRTTLLFKMKQLNITA
jgi:DNA-binding NtrC family response regulator/Tfp pilus assembly protein PilF